MTPTDATLPGPHGPVPVRRYRATGPDPARRTAPPTLVWLHGGGFFRGDLDQPEADAVARALGDHGLPVVTVDYRLGPVPGLPRFGRTGPRRRLGAPAAHDEVVAVVTALAERGERVVIGGASAGACIAAAVAATLRHGAGPDAAPLGVVLAYGFFQARLPRDRTVLRSVRGHRRLTHAPWALDAANRTYAGTGQDSADPRAFPGGHPVDAFPPTLMLDADHDAMRASGARFADELRSASTPVERHVLPGSRHAFLNRPATSDFADAVDRIAAWTADR